MGEVHLAPIGTEGTRTLLGIGVQSALHGFGLAPVAFVILDRYKNIGGLAPRDAAQLVACGLVAGRGEVQLVVVVAQEHGRIVGASRVQHVHLLHRVPAARLLPSTGTLCREQSCAGQLMVGHRVEYQLIFVGRLFVVAVPEQLASQAQVRHDVVLSVSDDVAVGGDGLWRSVQSVIAQRHSLGTLAAGVPFLGRCLAIGLLKLVGRIVILANGQKLFALLHVPFRTTAGQQ